MDNEEVLFVSNLAKSFYVKKSDLKENTVYSNTVMPVQFYLSNNSLNFERITNRDNFVKSNLQSFKDNNTLMVILALNINKSLFYESKYFKSNKNKYSYDVMKFHVKNNDYCTSEIIKILPEKSLMIRMNSLLGSSDLQLNDMGNFLSVGDVELPKKEFSVTN